MHSIIKATSDHAEMLSALAKTTFLESHGHSASPVDVDTYITANLNQNTLEKELLDPGSIYHLLFQDDVPAGYSKIKLNTPFPGADRTNVTKLERIYFLKRFYGQGLAQELFDFNLRLAKENQQAGIWLFVWKENQRAVNFYKKNGFLVVGSHDFKISDQHSNPNHIMFLALP